MLRKLFQSSDNSSISYLVANADMELQLAFSIHLLFQLLVSCVLSIYSKYFKTIFSTLCFCQDYASKWDSPGKKISEQVQYTYNMLDNDTPKELFNSQPLALWHRTSCCIAKVKLY